MFSSFFKRGKNTGLKRVRYRLESCVNTIIDLNERLGEGKIKSETIEHFKKLKSSFAYLDDDMVDEKEISLIEEATNELLKEIGKVYGDKITKNLYDVTKH